jgi:hypothetical protein
MSRKSSWRDRLVRACCNWMLRHVATDWYQAQIAGLIQAGLQSVYGEGPSR